MENTGRLETIITSRLPNGTGERMDKVLYGGELRSAFIRMAIETELKKREESRRRSRSKSKPLEMSA